MILVTGGLGFIGVNLIKRLNQLGHKDIVVVDVIKRDYLNELDYLEYVNGDDFLRRVDLFSKVSMIYHLGAISDTTERSVELLNNVNVEFSKALFELALQYEIPFIYASSAATYGLGENGFSDDHSLVDKLRPINLYAESKQTFDQWVLSQKLKPKKWLGLKFFNVYGPYENHKNHMSSMVYKSIKQIEASKKVKLFKSHNPNFEDGMQLRDFIYVKDAVNLSILLSKSNGENGLYNIGTGRVHSFKDLALNTFKALEIDPSIEYIEMPKSIRAQYQYYTEAKIDKMLEVIGSYHFYSLEESINDYVRDYKSTSYTTC